MSLKGNMEDVNRNILVFILCVETMLMKNKQNVYVNYDSIESLIAI